MVLFMFSFLNYLSGRWVQQLQVDLDALVHLDKPNVNALKCKLPVSHLGIFSCFVIYLSVQKQEVQPLQGSPQVHLYPSGPLVPLNLVPLLRKKRITFQFQCFYLNQENNKDDAPVLPFGPLCPSNPGRPVCPGGPSHVRNIIKCHCVRIQILYFDNFVFVLTWNSRKTTATCKKHILSC